MKKPRQDRERDERVKTDYLLPITQEVLQFFGPLKGEKLAW